MCKCGGENREGQAYCNKCHSEYMRKWRKTHKLTGEAKNKDLARHYAGVYFRRGKLLRCPCEVCGSHVKIQMHHDDYKKPLEVRWFCRRHHAEYHKNND